MIKVTCALKTSLFWLGIILIGFYPAVYASAPEDEDFGIWNNQEIEKKVRPDWKLRAGEELRYREAFGLSFSKTYAGVEYRAGKYLSAGANYFLIRNTRENRGKTRWFWENRPQIYLSPQVQMHGFDLENRHLIEFRILENIEDTLRYRSRFSLTAPYKWTPLDMQPFVSNEFFVETHKNGLTQNRLAAGFKMRVYRNLYGSLYYMRQSLKNSSGKWRDNNALGLSLKLVL